MLKVQKVNYCAQPQLIKNCCAAHLSWIIFIYPYQHPYFSSVYIHCAKHRHFILWKLSFGRFAETLGKLRFHKVSTSGNEVRFRCFTQWYFLMNLVSKQGEPEFFCFFFYLGFLSRTFTIHGTAGEGDT